MRNKLMIACLAGLLTAVRAGDASANDETGKSGGWFSGDWYLKVGAAGFTQPKFEGDDSYEFAFLPIISLGKAGSESRFESRNDNISLGLLDTGDPDLRGLSKVGFGVEVGGFAEIYPNDWLRLRGEVRQGIAAHDGLVADFQVDAYTDITPQVRVSAGPRLSFASSDYFEAYYGVDPVESAASGLAVYSPGGGLKSYGVGGAIDWKTTDRLTTSLFAEYSRLGSPAADSSLVRERGSPNQYLIGVSATYRFDFSL
jgi:outer membrane protein